MTPEEERALRLKHRAREELEQAHKRGRKLCYFAQGEDGGPIKIGAAYRPLERIRAFQPWCPYRLVLLAVLSGGHATESEMHRRFADAQTRSRGEWFHPVPPLLALIEAIAQPLCIHCGHPADADFEQCSECAAWSRVADRRGDEKFAWNYHPAWAHREDLKR